VRQISVGTAEQTGTGDTASQQTGPITPLLDESYTKQTTAISQDSNRDEKKVSALKHFKEIPKY